LCPDLLIFAVLTGLASLAGFIVDDGAAVVVAAGAVATTGGVRETTGGRYGASVAGAASLVCVAGAAVVVVCGAEVCSVPGDIDRLRSPAWADAEARIIAATRMILRIEKLPVFA
jgi:hypothetical protein